jgi:hypothetical protein
MPDLHAVQPPRPAPPGATSLKFPKLFALVVLLFLLDLIVPDFIPFADEIILGVLSLMLGLLRRPKGAQPTDD